MWLEVWEYNPKAIAFYETLGFKVIGAHSFFIWAVILSEGTEP